MTARKRVVVESPQPDAPKPPKASPSAATAVPRASGARKRQGPDPSHYEPAVMIVVHKDFGPKVQKVVRRFLWDWPVHGLDKAIKNAVKR